MLPLLASEVQQVQQQASGVMQASGVQRELRLPALRLASANPGQQLGVGELSEPVAPPFY